MSTVAGTLCVCAKLGYYGNGSCSPSQFSATELLHLHVHPCADSSDARVSYLHWDLTSPKPKSISCYMYDFVEAKKY